MKSSGLFLSLAGGWLLGLLLQQKAPLVLGHLSSPHAFHPPSLAEAETDLVAALAFAAGDDIDCPNCTEDMPGDNLGSSILTSSSPPSSSERRLSYYDPATYHGVREEPAVPGPLNTWKCPAGEYIASVVISYSNWVAYISSWTCSKGSVVQTSYSVNFVYGGSGARYHFQEIVSSLTTAPMGICSIQYSTSVEGMLATLSFNECGSPITGPGKACPSGEALVGFTYAQEYLRYDIGDRYTITGNSFVPICGPMSGPTPSPTPTTGPLKTYECPDGEYITSMVLYSDAVVNYFKTLTCSKGSVVSTDSTGGGNYQFISAGEGACSMSWVVLAGTNMDPVSFMKFGLCGNIIGGTGYGIYGNTGAFHTTTCPSNQALKGFSYTLSSYGGGSIQGSTFAPICGPGPTTRTSTCSNKPGDICYDRDFPPVTTCCPTGYGCVQSSWGVFTKTCQLKPYRPVTSGVQVFKITALPEQYLNLAEVEVFTTSGDKVPYWLLQASLDTSYEGSLATSCVDGVNTGGYCHGLQGATLSIGIPKAEVISYIRVYNRVECCKDRTYSATCKLYSATAVQIGGSLEFPSTNAAYYDFYFKATTPTPTPKVPTPTPTPTPPTPTPTTPTPTPKAPTPTPSPTPPTPTPTTPTPTPKDTTSPVLTGCDTAARTVEATKYSGAVVMYTKPTAYDAVSGTRTVTCTPPSNSTFAIGTKNVVCSASDTSNNTASCSFAITVVDSKPPVLSGCGTSLTVDATKFSGAVVTFVKPTAYDAVSGTRTVTCTPPSNSTFAIGTKNVVCSASDTSNNTASCGFTVTVVPATTPTPTPKAPTPTPKPTPPTPTPTPTPPTPTPSGTCVNKPGYQCVGGTATSSCCPSGYYCHGSTTEKYCCVKAPAPTPTPTPTPTPNPTPTGTCVNNPGSRCVGGTATSTCCPSGFYCHGFSDTEKYCVKRPASTPTPIPTPTPPTPTPAPKRQLRSI